MKNDYNNNNKHAIKMKIKRVLLPKQSTMLSLCLITNNHRIKNKEKIPQPARLLDFTCFRIEKE